MASRGCCENDCDRHAVQRSLYRHAPSALLLASRSGCGSKEARDLAERCAAAARGHDRARLRIDLVPGEEPTIVATPLGELGPVILRPVVVPGGLGPHKWRDRALLQAHEADDPGSIPLLLDADGYVLEASRASIVVRGRDGLLYTPPDDGRILPGVTARLAGAAPRVLTLADLDAAEAVFAASALRGLSPARLSPRERRGRRTSTAH
jgi:para-aminobenzoate synthetase/4-amino-4-deoxychorismate lyase